MLFKMSNTKIRYLIEPELKKSTYEEQIWTNKLKNNKTVSVKVGNLFRWGSFYIDLDEKEKKELCKKDNILVNDYDNFELIEMWDGGCDFWVDIVDEDNYTEQEIQEINSMIYDWPNGECPDDEDEEGYDEQKMELNGWYETDCEYYITAPFKLELVTQE
jgi:hypothetical protein